MKIIVFVTTLFVLSAYGKSFLKDVPPPKLGRKLPLFGGKSVGKLPLDQPILSLLSRKSMKSLLSKSVLKQWPLPKLSIQDITSESNSKSLKQRMKSVFKQSNNKEKEEITADRKIGALGMPKLIASAPKPSKKAGSGSKSKAQKFGGYFGFLLQKAKMSTTLMNAGALQKETCFTILHNETVTSKGCEPTTRLNRICTGRCNSFFVPGSYSDFKSCASCTPSRQREEYVTLKCPKKKFGIAMKRIQIILECKCQSMMSC